MIWRASQIVNIAGRALEAGAAIDSTLARRRVDLEGAAAWGQYLDEDHYSDAQWGLLGTTAAVATLALRARPPEENRHIREALRIVRSSTLMISASSRRVHPPLTSAFIRSASRGVRADKPLR